MKGEHPLPANNGPKRRPASRRDNQKSRLYIAESLTDQGRRFTTVTEMQKYVDDLFDKRQVKSRWGNRSVEVRHGGGRRNAWGGYGIVKMPIWSRCEHILLHEVAHCLTPDRFAPHGPEFAGILLFLTGQARSVMARQKLRAAFREGRVKVSMSAIPEATISVRTKTEVQAERRAARQRPLTASEAILVSSLIKRAVNSGVFGPAGRKPRSQALAVARRIGTFGPSTSN